MKSPAKRLIFVATFAMNLTALCTSAAAQTNGAGQWIDSQTASQVLPYAYLSEDAYNQSANPGYTPGWKKVEDWEQVFLSDGLSREIAAGKASGFYAAVYQNQTTGEISIGYQGTKGLTDLSGLATDVAAQAGLIPVQYKLAQQLAQILVKQFPNATITVTGHSKGGGEATYAGQVPGIARVITFNSAGPPFLAHGVNQKQINVAVPGELIGDPNTKSFLGPSQLPGQLYYVHSMSELAPTPALCPGCPNPIQDARSVFQGDFSQTHLLPGLIGGLTAVSKSVPSPAIASPTVTVTRPASSEKMLATANSAGNPAVAQEPKAASPGGISLNRAAAERMPLDLALDASSFFDGKVILSGRPSRGGMDAALFLTTLRAACDEHDPYFSLDPDNGTLWSQQGERASEEFWERIKKDFPPVVPRGEKSAQGVRIHTIAATQNYPGIWRDISPHYPNFRSKLVFYPEWLRSTRLGEILYKADVLLKELSAGVSILAPGRLRASAIPGYLSSDVEFTAKSLLAGTRDQTAIRPQWRGSRLWFDIAPSAPAATALVGTVPTSSSGDPNLRSLLQTNGFMRPADQVAQDASFVVQHGNVFDLSHINPRMFVRVHDPATNQDLSDHDPRLDGLATDVSRRFDQYAASYEELRLLRDVVRAYIAAIKISDGNEQMCRALDALPLNELEKVAAPLPDYHSSELFVTVGNYWTTSRKGSEVQFARTSSMNGGVSIAGQEFAESATHQGETAVTRAFEAAIAIGLPGRSNLPSFDRVFVAFTVEDASGAPVRLVSNASNPFSPRSLNDYRIENEPPVTKQPPASRGSSQSQGQWGAIVLLTTAFAALLFGRRLFTSRR